MAFLGIFGHVVLDHIISLPHLPLRNLSVQVLSREDYFGGTAGNISRGAARLGVDVCIASFVGGDFPVDYRKLLMSDGIDVTDLRFVEEGRTPTAWIFLDPKQNQTTIIDQGAMAKSKDLPVLTHTIEASKVLHLGTGKPEYYLRVAKVAEGKVISFDPSQEIHYFYNARSFAKLLRKATYFFGNEAEIRRAVKFTRSRKPSDILRFVDVVVATKGENGSVIMQRDGKIEIPCVKARKVVDITGAGDAYRAGFYAALSRGLDLTSCGLFGAGAASFVVEEKGPQTNLPAWEAVEHRIAAYQ